MPILGTSVNRLQGCIGPRYVPSFTCGKGFASKRRFPMVKLTVLYGHPDDPDAFEEYYANTHMPLVDKMPNLQSYEAARVVATPDGSEPPYYRIFEGYFGDMEQLQSSMALRRDRQQPTTSRMSPRAGRRSSSLRWTRRRPLVTPTSENSVSAKFVELGLCAVHGGAHLPHSPGPEGLS